MSIYLHGGRLIDPSLGLDQVGDVLITGHSVSRLGNVVVPDSDSIQIDCRGLVVCPGWIDMHVHLRAPGQEHKETVATGTAAAAAGGFTALACMPNTEPALDSVETIEWLARACREEAQGPVFPIAAITKERAGRELVDFDALVGAGAVGFSDDGISTADAGLMIEALIASKRLGRPIMVHCEDPELVGGSMHAGEVSRRLGVPGIPAAAEENFIARDCALAADTGGWLHVLHVSTGTGLDTISRARQNGARITAEVMPHHLVMSDEWVGGSRALHNTDEQGLEAIALHPDTKVNPPLRPAEDTALLLAGLQAGGFDILATDHAPHAASEKREITFERAAFGMIGLELAVPTMLALVRAGHLSLNEVIYRFSTMPARLWDLPVGKLEVGRSATLSVIDPNRVWTVNDDTICSKSKNTPLYGRTLTGQNVVTIIEGKVVHDNRA